MLLSLKWSTICNFNSFLWPPFLTFLMMTNCTTHGLCPSTSAMFVVYLSMASCLQIVHVRPHRRNFLSGFFVASSLMFQLSLILLCRRPCSVLSWPEDPGPPAVWQRSHSRASISCAICGCLPLLFIIIYHSSMAPGMHLLSLVHKFLECSECLVLMIQKGYSSIYTINIIAPGLLLAISFPHLFILPIAIL